MKIPSANKLRLPETPFGDKYLSTRNKDARVVESFADASAFAY